VSFAFRRSYRGRLRAAVLDWAGTTVDFGSCAPASTFADVFARRGVEITSAEARAPMGLAKRAHIAAIARGERVARRWEEVAGAPVGEADVDAMYREFVPLQLARLPDHADLIPGVLDALAHFRERGLAIGSTTGYSADMMAVLSAEARRRGYEPDCVVTASDAPRGRPEPWMLFRAAERLGVFPLEAVVKIGDTVADVEEGLNAGAWTIGLARCGNEMGCSERELAALPAEAAERRLAAARARLAAAGAHFVADDLAACPPLLDEIDRALASGERP
jgi:phosphonoacetaldehyde hydrolase